MFDFAWSEIALIGVVALVAIGPKDMPVAIKAISDTIKKLRRMASEFQGHVDEMIREADLGDAKSAFDELRGMNVKSAMKRALDPDGKMVSALADPFAAHPVRPVMTAMPSVMPEETIALPQEPPPPAIAAPAFIPPGAAPPAPIQPVVTAPPFIPPSASAERT